jgi:predicted glycoside hydrolase/deacetylase ChbG (UPF0249 family)
VARPLTLNGLTWKKTLIIMTLSGLIVNADDFGHSVSVNHAILRSFERSLVNSTSLMANMPGFGHAVGLIHEHTVLQGKVGLHLNLTEGTPLSRGILDCAFFCNEGGRYIYDRSRPLFRLSRPEQQALYEEMQAQLEKLLDAGIHPTHLDSHHHVHTEWAIAPLVCRLARAYGIRRIRLTRNMGAVDNYPRRLYKKVFNRWYLGPRSGLANTDYFGDIRDMKMFSGTAGAGAGAGRSFEIMVHPLFDERENLVDYDQKDLQQELQPILQLNHNLLTQLTDLNE